MKCLLLAALTLVALPALAAEIAPAVDSAVSRAPLGSTSDAGVLERRGRGRGGDGGGHGGRPRVPGGSGCDDPEDILEHPECRL